MSRSLANEAVEHILTALSLSLLLLVSGTGIKFQRLICLFPPRSRCLQDAIGLPGAAPIREEGVRPCLTASKMYGASQQCLYSGPGIQSQVPNVAVLYQNVGEKPGFLQQEVGIHMNVDPGLGVAAPKVFLFRVQTFY